MTTKKQWLQWLDDVDCGWRKDHSTEKPCTFCKRLCHGRGGNTDTAVCFTCYHNVGTCQSAAMCGSPVGTTIQSRYAEMMADIKQRKADAA